MKLEIDNAFFTEEIIGTNKPGETMTAAIGFGGSICLFPEDEKIMIYLSERDVIVLAAMMGLSLVKR